MGLGAESLDDYEALPYQDANIKGEAMKFTKAYLKIGDKQIVSTVDNTKNTAILEIEVEQGETDLAAYFDLENGGSSNAFYVYVEKLE
ncbi:hypothetical protein GCM10023314_11740 [Algibacter agarivorans]|uniref:Uncharacterized protein n=1 Tax=Algibacter agarivorans TaxID=1109741 RepID=A0ABP9GF34_9FLAO